MTSWPLRGSRRKNSRKSTDGANPTLSNLLMKFWPVRALALMSSWLRNWSERLDIIERIDRQAAIAENRRNTMLGEIDRRRTVLGEALRIKEVEDAEFQVVEPTSAKRKTAA
jgi:hypothetical protein